MADNRMEILHDVNLGLTVEVGRCTKPLRDVLRFAPGEIVVLDRPAGAPADLLVNGALFARGQIVEASDTGEYAIRITEVVVRGQGSSGQGSTPPPPVAPAEAPATTSSRATSAK